jgi:hypothetical protein
VTEYPAEDRHHEDQEESSRRHDRQERRPDEPEARAECNRRGRRPAGPQRPPADGREGESGEEEDPGDGEPDEDRGPREATGHPPVRARRPTPGARPGSEEDAEQAEQPPERERTVRRSFVRIHVYRPSFVPTDKWFGVSVNGSPWGCSNGRRPNRRVGLNGAAVSTSEIVRNGEAVS